MKWFGQASRMTSRQILLLSLIFVLAFSVRMAFLHEPFERDEGVFACLGQVILNGGIPYRDAIDIKPPGIFYLYAAALALAGKTPESIRIFTAFYALFTLGTVFWLARAIAGTAAALAAAAIFALYSGAPLLQGSSCHTEVFMVLPLMASACFLVAALERQGRRLLFISGLCAGLALFIKTVALPSVMVLCVSSFFRQRKGARLTERCLDAGAFMLPMLALAIATVAYFRAKGALPDFIYWNFTRPYLYAFAGAIYGPSFTHVIRYLAHELLLPAVLGFPAALCLARGTKGERIVALLLLAACLGIWLPGKFFPHYFIQIYPVMSVTAGVAAAWLWGARGRTRILGCLLMALSFFHYVGNDFKLFFLLDPETVSTVKYGPVFADSVHVARYVRERTKPSDYIFQWGFEPELYFLADRPCPTVPYFTSVGMGMVADPDAAVRHLVAGITARKPVYIIIQPEWIAWPGYYNVDKIVREGYRLEATVRYARIYRRI